mgnify:CR=1 FL=1
MDIGSILLIFSAALLSAAFISRPLLKVSKGGPSNTRGEARALEGRRAAILADRDRVLGALGKA